MNKVAVFGATGQAGTANSQPGVWTQGSFVEPNAFFDYLQQAGIRVNYDLQKMSPRLAEIGG